MKVLWFTNTPSLSKKLLCSSMVSGGWIESLEKVLQKNENIELVIAFISDMKNRSDDLRIDGTLYKPINKNNSNVDEYLKVVEKYKPDLIQIFGTENNYGLIIDKIDIPVLIHIQGILTPYEMKKALVCSTYKTFYKIEKYKKTFNVNISINNTIKKIRNHLSNRSLNKLKIEREIYRKCKYFTGRTSWDKFLVNTLSLSATYFHCDELLREDFHTKEWNNKNGELNIISILNPSVYKGIETILETSYLLKNKGINFNWKIVGIGNNFGIVQKILNMYKLVHSSCNIEFVGKKTSEQLIELMMSSNIFVHPSHIENSSNAVCEAMLLGMPVISTFSGGTGSLLEHNKEGILIQDGDPYAMSGAIIDIFKNPGKASELGKNARSRAIIRHDPDKISKRIIEIYKQIIKINMSK